MEYIHQDKWWEGQCFFSVRHHHTSGKKANKGLVVLLHGSVLLTFSQFELSF